MNGCTSRSTTTSAEPSGRIRVTCPDCGASFDADPRFVVWCETCGWNADPSPPSHTPGPRAALRRRRARSLDARLRSYVAGGRPLPERRPSWTAPAAVAVAGLVHLVTVALLALAVALLLLAPQVFVLFRLLGAALLVAVALQVRPQPAPPARGNKMREGGAATGQQVTAGERAQLPAVFGVVHMLCAALSAPEPHLAVVDDGFDVVVTGAGRRRTLVVGFALWAILDTEQRAAALARALAEQVSGRLRDGGWVGAARGSVQGWTHLLEATGPEDLRRVRPRRRGRRAGPARTEPNVTDRAVDVTLAVLLSPLAVPVLLLGRLLDRLVADDVTPRADVLAAAAVGSDAMLSLLGAATLVPAAGAALRRAVEEGAPDVWAAERATVAALPEHEHQRLRRLADRPPLAPADVPSLALRRSLLAVAPRRPAQLALGDAIPLAVAELARPAAELAGSLTGAARRL